MAKCFQYDHKGYFVGEVDDYGLIPNNATYTAPEEREGHIPQWNGEVWLQVENHKGKEGYKDGQPHTITAYGPMPKGWSDTPPPPTQAEQTAQRIAEIDARLAEIDRESIRPLRALLDDDGTDADKEKLAALEQEAATLRAERKALEG